MQGFFLNTSMVAYKTVKNKRPNNCVWQILSYVYLHVADTTGVPMMYSNQIYIHGEAADI